MIPYNMIKGKQAGVPVRMQGSRRAGTDGRSRHAGGKDGTQQACRYRWKAAGVPVQMEPSSDDRSINAGWLDNFFRRVILLYKKKWPPT